VIAVEPNTEVAASINPTPGLFVIAAAVSDTWGLAAFHHYADSSSLLEPNLAVAITTEQVLQKGRQGAKVIVPTLPLSAILRSVAKLSCYFLKIDTQGMDFVVIRTAHRDIRRCKYVQAEVYCNGYDGYVGARNDYDTDWLPYMRSLGFEPLSKCDHPTIPSEKNILWRNTEAQDVEPLEVVAAKCPKCVT
jgi:FkbM family methyltransferase